VCENCRAAFKLQDFEGCVRCGKRNCIGAACGKLQIFAGVETLVSYVEPYTSLIQFAKIEQRVWAQNALRDLFSEKIVDRLSEIIVKHQITHCHLVPISVWRIFSLKWHTNQLFLLAFAKMNQRKLCTVPELKCEISFSIFKSSSRSAFSRGEAIKNKPTCEHLSAQGQNVSVESTAHLNVARRVLILDDVLTSGGTVLAFVEKLKKDLDAQVPIGSEFFLLTLMRSPMKSVQQVLSNSPIL
jgi:predicted amidophosphoribosyltransferase